MTKFTGSWARGHLIWLILRQGMVLSAAGLVVRLRCAWCDAAARTFLFGVGVVDSIAISTTVVTLAAVAVLAVKSRRGVRRRSIRSRHSEPSESVFLH
jgi:hypothetical protein